VLVVCQQQQGGLESKYIYNYFPNKIIPILRQIDDCLKAWGDDEQRRAEKSRLSSTEKTQSSAERQSSGK